MIIARFVGSLVGMAVGDAGDSCEEKRLASPRPPASKLPFLVALHILRRTSTFRFTR